MLETLPSPVRSALWRVKHAALTWSHHRGLSEYLQAALADQLRRQRITVALDVGANTGQYARMLRRIGYAGEILSIEPVPQNVQLLERQASVDGHWRVVRLALGVEAADTTLHLAAESVYSSLLPTSDYAAAYHPGSHAIAHVPVRVERLDHVLPDLVADLGAQRVHLKVDTQGTDLDVLRGAAGCLDVVHSLQFELGIQALYTPHTPYAEALGLIDAMGFALAGVFPVGRDHTGTVVDADCLFVRRA